MRTKQGNMLRSLTNVKTFLDEHAAKLGGVVTTGVRKQLDNAIVALSVHATDQAKHTITGRQFTQRQRALRKELVQEHMQPIVRIARLSLPDTPELLPLRSLPRQETSPERLASVASGMGEAASLHHGLFVSAGLPKDFVGQLEAATDAVVKILNTRDQIRSKAGAATTSLHQQLVTGRKVVDVLDSFVKKALKEEPVLLRNWNLVKRVPKTAVQSAIPIPIATPAAPHTSAA